MIQTYKTLGVQVISDGISNTFTISVSHACALINIPDISPVDDVIPAGQGNFPGISIPATVTLNGKGTIVTLTFASTPPKAALTDASNVTFTVLLNT